MLLYKMINNKFCEITKTNLGGRLIHGTFWSLFGAITSRLISLMTFVFVARLLGLVDYGKFGIVQSTVSMFGVFAGFGLGQASTKYIAELRYKHPERAGRIIALSGLVAMAFGVIVASILFVLSPWLANKTLSDPGITNILRIGSFILLIESMIGAQIGALVGLEAFKTTAKINMILSVLSFPLIMGGVYIGGLVGGVWGLAMSRIINLILNYLAMNYEARISGIVITYKYAHSEIKILWEYGFPSMLSGAMVSPTLWVCNSMLVNTYDGYAQMGLLQATMIFQQILLFIGNAISAPLMPLLASNIGECNERLDKVNMLLTWAIGVLVADFFLGVPEIAALIYGNQFNSHYFVETFVLIVLCSSVIVYKQGLSRVLSANGMMWWGMLSNFIWGLSMVVSTWYFVNLGAFGYALAMTISYVLNTVIFIPLYVYKKLVPKGTVVSLEAGLIWGLLILEMLLNYMHMGIVIRVLFMLMSGIAMIGLFWRLIKKK